MRSDAEVDIREEQCYNYNYYTVPEGSGVEEQADKESKSAHTKKEGLIRPTSQSDYGSGVVTALTIISIPS